MIRIAVMTRIVVVLTGNVRQMICVVSSFSHKGCNVFVIVRILESHETKLYLCIGHRLGWVLQCNDSKDGLRVMKRSFYVGAE